MINLRRDCVNCGKNVMSHKRTWGKFWVSSCVPTNAMRAATAAPDYEKLVALADYFDVTTDYLLGRSDVRG